jgi:hypothetical protein
MPGAAHLPVNSCSRLPGTRFQRRKEDDGHLTRSARRHGLPSQDGWPRIRSLSERARRPSWRAPPHRPHARTADLLARDDRADLRDAAGHNQPSAREHRYAIGQRFRLLQIVRRQDDRATLREQLANRAPHGFAGVHVEADGFRVFRLRRRQPRARSYIINVIAPVATSAPAQIRSRLNQVRRSMPTPSFSNTSIAMNAVIAR